MSFKLETTQSMKNAVRPGDIIRDYRKRHGYTLESLAKEIKCPVSTLQGYESGSRKYPLNYIASIGKTLKIPLKSFLEACVDRVLKENGIAYTVTLHEIVKKPLHEEETEII